MEDDEDARIQRQVNGMLFDALMECWEWAEEWEPLPGMDASRWYARYRYSYRGRLPLRQWDDLPVPEGAWKVWKSAGLMSEAWVDFQDARYRRLRHEEGIVRGTRLWVGQALEMWWRNQHDGGSHLPADDRLLLRLAVGMKQNIAIRDALIVSAVSITPLDWETLLRFASEPSCPGNASAMGGLLTEAFDEPKAVPRVGCMRASVAMLERMAELVPVSYRVNILACAAYLMWWVDDPRTDIVARIARHLDPTCTLAGIVIDALGNGVKPEWCLR